MATPRSTIKNGIASGDHIWNKTQQNFGQITRTSVESKLAGKGDGHERHELLLNLASSSDISEEESAYNESFDSEISESESEESELTVASSHRPPIDEISKFQSLSPSSYARHDSTNIKRKFASTSKIWENKPFKLEDKFKCMSLSEVRSLENELTRSNKKNMSFTNEATTKIEQENEALLRKIMAQQKFLKTRQQPIEPKLSSSAINRQRYQKKIEGENLFLLRRLQQAKSCIVNTHKISGCRRTIL